MRKWRQVQGKVNHAGKTHRPMSKRDRRHKPGAKKPQWDGQMCFIQQQARKQPAMHFQLKKNAQSLIRSELMNSQQKRKERKKDYSSKNNPPHMKHCFAF